MKTTPPSRLSITAALWLLIACHTAFAGLWTPENLGDRLWLDWWQEDLADGAVSSWTSRKGAVAATQATSANQPTKQNGEVYFANAQRLSLPAQGNACLAHRAIVIIFRIDLSGSGDGAIFAANGVSGGNERQPIVAYNRNTDTVSVGWKTPGGYNSVAWTLTNNPSQWHCIVSRRIGNMHYASLDGQPETSVTMADYAVPRNSVTGYIGDFRTSTPIMAIDSIMIVQDELSADDARKLMGWAMWRKGQQSLLPTDHPYRNQPPMSGNDTLTSEDIGAPAPAGSTTVTPPESFQISAGGSGIWSTSDSFHFAHQAVQGDSELIVKVESLTNTSTSAKAGVMLRSSVSASSPFVSVCARPGTNGVVMNWRSTSGGTTSASTTASLALPRWVKLTRAGNIFTGYESADGTTWTQVNQVTITMPKVIRGGLAATSAVQSTAATAAFSSLSIQDSRPVYAFVESTTAEYDALKAFWLDTTQSEQFKGTPMNLMGWNLNFEDSFDTHTVSNDVTGEGPWYAPTHGAACGSATAVTPTDSVPQGNPATYIQSGSEMTIRMQQVSGNWKSGVFCSVNSNGYGRTWMYPYIEVRMKASPGNAKGAWPALWVKSENFFYNLTESYMEYDIYEGYVSDNDGYHNSYHNWPNVRKLAGRLQSHRYMSNYLGLHTPGWNENVNLFDNAYHTYGVMITPTVVITMFDGKEMFRFPTPIEMKQPIWTLLDLALLPSEASQASGTYDLTIDYFRVYQNPAFHGAAMASTFNDAEGTTSSDQYPGIGEDGWAGGWVENSSTDITATVSSTSPLTPGAGNYLSIFNGDTTTSGSNDTIIRQYTSANGVVLTEPHTITFDYRLDSPASQMTGSDAIVIFNSTGTGADSSAANGYCLSAYYANGMLQWRWQSGDKAGSGTWINTGMAVVTGVVYHFTINLDPANKEYTVSIFDGTTTVTSAPLGYRTAAAAPASLSYLAFGSRDTTSGQTITQSLDNLTITP